MKYLWKAIGIGILVELAAVAFGLLLGLALYVPSLLEGSRWAAVLGLLIIPLLLFRFPEKQRSRRP